MVAAAPSVTIHDQIDPRRLRRAYQLILSWLEEDRREAAIATKESAIKGRPATTAEIGVQVARPKYPTQATWPADP